MEIKYEETDLDRVMRFWASHYTLPPNTHVHSLTWYVHPQNGRVLFKLCIADGPDHLA